MTRRAVPLFLCCLVCLPLQPATARVGNLLEAPRLFPMEEYGTLMHAADFTGDGIEDLLTGQTVLVGAGDGTFSDALVIEGAYGFETRAVGDLNGDGLLDIVTAVDWSGDTGRIQVLLGNGNGTFYGFQTYDTAGYPAEAQLGDLDGDGDLDLALLGGANDQLVSHLNDGSGAFAAPWSRRVGDAPIHLDLGDYDGDGTLDAAVIHDQSEDLRIYLGNGDGTFPGIPSIPLAEADWITEMDSADLNGDGLPDLAVEREDFYDTITIGILLGQGDGTFVESSSITQPEFVYRPHLWLVDDDQLLDLVVVASDGVWLHPGLGDGTFGTGTIVATGNSPTNADAADLDGDGHTDLVVGNAWGDTFFAIFGDGSGGFSAPVEYPVEDRPEQITLGDLDLDGDPDLIYSRDGYPYTDNYIRLNDGAGGFAAETEWPTPVAFENLLLADMDGDGALDALTNGYAALGCYPGLGDGSFGEGQFYYGADEYSRALTIGDFDGDADQDVALGDGFWSHAEEMLFLMNTTTLGNVFAAGPGRGEENPSRVRVFTVADPVRRVAEWQAYGVDRYGVNAVLGELDGSPGFEALTGAGPGAVFGPHVRGFQAEGTPLPGLSFLAYGTNKYGVNVAAGDLDGDAYDEIVTGAGPGAVFGPHVRGWNWDASGVTPTPIPGMSWFAYGTPKWGVNVSCGDIDGDGFDEVVTGAGPGAVYGPHVRGWDCDGSGATPIPGVSFLAYGTNKYGVNVCCGDIDGDGIDEMVTGAGPGSVFGPHVRGWNWDGVGSVQSIPGVSFFAFSYSQWGANVSCGELDGDGIDEILVGPGPGTGHQPRIRAWNYDGTSLSAITGIDFQAFDPGEVTHGVKPAGLRAGRR